MDNIFVVVGDVFQRAFVITMLQIVFLLSRTNFHIHTRLSIKIVFIKEKYPSCGLYFNISVYIIEALYNYNDYFLPYADYICLRELEIKDATGYF
jgi:hypothetical protein